MIGEDLIKKYADMVTKEDVQYLLLSLLDTQKLTEIAQKCDLTRRTLYKLEDRKDIQFKTKMKILKASIETSPSETLNFLVERCKDDASDILMLYLSHLYNEAAQKTTAVEFKNALSSFLEARTRHFGLISDKIDSEVSTMLRFLEETALKFGVELPPESLSTTKQDHLLETFPFLVSSLYFQDSTPRSLAKVYNVPLEWTQSVLSAIGSMSLIGVQEHAQEPERTRELTAAAMTTSRTTTFETKPVYPGSQGNAIATLP